MADISPQQIPDFGNLLTSYSRNQAGIDLTQAQTGLTSAQTGLTKVNTQKAAYEVSMIKQAMEAMKNLPTGQSEQSGETNPDPTETGVASSLNSKFYVNPVGPPGIQQYINATAWVNPAEAQRAEEWRKLLVQSQTSKNQNEANDVFQTSYALKDSPNPLQSLLSLKPGSYLNNLGRAISSMQDKSPEEKDDMARKAVESAAKYSHQYTGRDTEVVGDEVRDKTTKFPVLAPNAGPTAGEKIGLGQWLNTPQKVTIDNREATVKPKDLGISGYGDLTGNKSVKFSVPPPQASQSQANTPSGDPKTQAPGSTPGMAPGAAQQPLAGAGKSAIPGLSKDQSDFVTSQPDAFPGVKSNQALNAVDVDQRKIYLKQKQDLAQSANQIAQQSQNTLTNVTRINQLLDNPNLTLGPGSREYSQMQTFLNQWFGTPAGQAPAYQILSKFLNADQMNSILKQFHGEGAQVRLGAYESRLIMEQLAANPQMTKEAIQQMLKWQTSDATYDYQKAQVAASLVNSGKSVQNFESNYQNKFPKQQSVDTTLAGFRTPKAEPNYVGAKGKTYTNEQVEDAAHHMGVPVNEFKRQLLGSGATIK